LKNYKSVFCPEPWELYDFVETGSDPDGTIGPHMVECSLCSEEAASLRSGFADARMPDAVREAFLPRCFPAAKHEARPQRMGFGARLVSVLVARVPILALGSAAAAIFLALYLNVSGEPEPVLGLASVSWEDPRGNSAPQPTLRFQGISKGVSSASSGTDFAPVSPSTEHKPSTRSGAGGSPPRILRDLVWQ
jgi:hypothetical protein